MNALVKSRYHITIVTLYFFLCLYFFFFTKLPQTLFVYRVGDLKLVVPIFLGACVSFVVINYFLHFGTLGLHKKNVSRLPLIVIYAGVLIAVPEEILFRGFIQTYLGSLFSGAVVPIMLSSLFFGLAHSFNGAVGFRPTQWKWKLVAMTFLAGIFLGAVFYMTGSLVVPIILHTLFVVVMKIFIKDPKKGGM